MLLLEKTIKQVKQPVLVNHQITLRDLSEQYNILYTAYIFERVGHACRHNFNEVDFVCIMQVAREVIRINSLFLHFKCIAIFFYFKRSKVIK